MPLGTANVLAAELGLPLAPERAAAVLAAGAVREIRPGIANGRLFTITVGAGFDARVVARVSPGLKRRLGKLAYAVETAREWLAMRPCRLVVTVDGRRFEAAAAVIANGHFYAGRFILAPRASLGIPTLEVCLFERGGRWPAVRYLAAMALGLLPRLWDYRIVTGTRIRIEGPADEPVQAEGDIIGRLPLEASMAPDALSIIVDEG
jgi:diacylglycerol kinase family enzyme